jgi:hypothetical protein
MNIPPQGCRQKGDRGVNIISQGCRQKSRMEEGTNRTVPQGFWWWGRGGGIKKTFRKFE